MLPHSREMISRLMWVPVMKRFRRKADRKHVEAVNMHEFRRTALSLKMMFGSSRFWLAILAIGFFAIAAYVIQHSFGNDAGGLQAADQLWNQDQNVEAVREYKALLGKRDRVSSQYAMIQGTDRVRLYRRIISHEARFGNRAEARDWITKAYGEGINFESADFESAQVHQLWVEVTKDYQDPVDARKNRSLLDEATQKQ